MELANEPMRRSIHFNWQRQPQASQMHAHSPATTSGAFKLSRDPQSIDLELEFILIVQKCHLNSA